MVETASARDQVVEEELSDQEEVIKDFFIILKEASWKPSAYTHLNMCDFGSWKRKTQ